MKIKDIQNTPNQGTGSLSMLERRTFLKLGLTITGVFLSGTVLSLTSAKRTCASSLLPLEKDSPYSPHYCMVIRENRCIDCELCKEACITTNNVPEYGWRTEILEKRRSAGVDTFSTTFMPVLCNHCSEPPCVRTCPTQATWKDEKTGIVRMNPDRCIGCKTCMTACPYDARYFNEETRAIDKCDFCFETLLSKGETQTACATACPADVRIFGDLADTENRVYQILHEPENVIWVLRPETGALPNVFYTNG